MSLEGEQIFYTYQGQAVDIEEGIDDQFLSKDDALVKFARFIREWQKDN